MSLLEIGNRSKIWIVFSLVVAIWKIISVSTSLFFVEKHSCRSSKLSAAVLIHLCFIRGYRCLKAFNCLIDLLFWNFLPCNITDYFCHMKRGSNWWHCITMFFIPTNKSNLSGKNTIKAWFTSRSYCFCSSTLHTR